MSRINVGVLRGGPSSEYDVSLKTGGSILRHLPEQCVSHDILIDKEGRWHIRGMERPAEKILKGIDVAINAMHGEYGEDGQVQRILDSFYVPYTGSGALASAIGMNKALSKGFFKKQGIKTPLHLVVRADENHPATVSHIHRNFPQPSVVKPSSAGSSVGVSIVKDRDSLERALYKAMAYGDGKTALVEEFIKGREATCGVVEGLRDRELYALFPVEILKPPENEFFDYDAKYSGKSQEICPGNFSRTEKEEMQKMAMAAHRALGLRHYSRSDFIVTANRGIYLLEVNTLPGLTPESLFPKSLAAVGVSFPDFLEHLITLALKR